MGRLQSSRRVNVAIEGRKKAVYDVSMDLLGEWAPFCRARIESLKRSLERPPPHDRATAEGCGHGDDSDENSSGDSSSESLPRVEIPRVGWDSAAWFIRLISSNGAFLRTHPVEQLTMDQACGRAATLMRLDVKPEDPLIQRCLARIVSLMQAGVAYTPPDLLLAREYHHDRFESALASVIVAAVMDGKLTEFPGLGDREQLEIYMSDWQHLAKDIEWVLHDKYIHPLLHAQLKQKRAPTPSQCWFIFTFIQEGENTWHEDECLEVAKGLLNLFDRGLARPADYWPLEDEYDCTFKSYMRRAIKEDQERDAKSKARNRHRGAANASKQSGNAARAA